MVRIGNEESPAPKAANALGSPASASVTCFHFSCAVVNAVSPRCPRNKVDVFICCLLDR